MDKLSPTISNVPKHIGIIMDGNRRFSRRLMMKPWKGHEWGAKKIDQVLEWCMEYGVRELTVYSFSIENFNRPKVEFDYLMNVFLENFRRIRVDKKIYDNKIRINVIGRYKMFPKELVDEIEGVMEDTKDHDKFTINLAMAYGGRSEVIDAVKKIAEGVKDGTIDVDAINDEVFEKNLYISGDPDLIIRTGGEKRTSNFLMWQSAYSEWIFIDKMWPEFEKKDLVVAISDYSDRKRRFGA